VRQSFMRSNSQMSDMSRPSTPGDIAAPGKRNAVFNRANNTKSITTGTFGDDLNFDSVIEICN
jgi:hypothetical protein